MGHKQWRGRCRLIGFDKIDAALAAKRPVIFATLHFGPLHLLHYWLRAFGHRATILTAASASDRNEIRRRKDFLSNQESGFAATPHVVPRGELKRAVRLLENSALIIAVDFPSTKYVDVPDGEVRFRASTGAIRLAASHGALLSPCLICEVAPWQFEIHCGRPVPDNLLSPSADMDAAAAHLWREFQPLLAAHPDQRSEELAARFPK